MVKKHNYILNNNILLTGLITYLFAYLTMIIMPVYHWFLPPFMILWGVIWLFEIQTRTSDIRDIKPQHKLLFVLFVLFFVWQILGMLYSDNPKDGWRNIELRLSLILFPLVLITPGEMIKRKITALLQLFAISTFLYLMICFGYALYRSLSFHNGVLSFNPHLPVYTWLNYFYSLELAIFQHTSYLSMYVLLSVFIAFESFFDKSDTKIHRYLWFTASIILLVSVYFLSSRAGILAAIILVPFYIFRKFRMQGRKKYLGIGILVGALILLPIALTNPRVNNYLKWRSGKELGSITIKEDRFIIWNSVANILKHNIVFGVGTGDIQAELNEEYLKTGNIKLAEENTNAHNQYIEVLLENGLIGLVLFLSLFGVMLYISISERNLIYIIFLFLVLFSFLFETMLNRLAGVTFFSLFSFLLIHVDVKKQPSELNTQAQYDQ